MNFIEAVQSVENGLCEGFRRKIWQENAYLVVDEKGALKFPDTAYIPLQCDFLADDYELFNPKPQTETVEVTRWLHKHKWNLISEQEPVHNMVDWIELNGLYQREIKPKVKRREEFTLKGSTKFADRPISNDALFFAEWEE